MTLQTPYATKRQVSQRFSLRTAPQTNRRTASTEIRHTQHRGLFSPLGTSLYSISGWDSSKGQLEGGVMAVHRKGGSCLREGPARGRCSCEGAWRPALTAVCGQQTCSLSSLVPTCLPDRLHAPGQLAPGLCQSLGHTHVPPAQALSKFGKK